MAVDALVIGRNALKNIGLLIAKNRVPFGRDALAVLLLCVPFCVAVVPFSQRLALFLVNMPSLLFRAFYSIRIFVNNEYQHSCAVHVDGENLELYEKAKTRTKLQKYPPQNSLKLPLPIVKNGHNLEIVLCTKALPIFPDWTLGYMYIQNLLARFSYDTSITKGSPKASYCTVGVRLDGLSLSSLYSLKPRNTAV